MNIKNTSINKAASIILFLCSISTLTVVYANNIEQDSFKTFIEGNFYYADIRLNINLTKNAQKALENGISLEIHTRFQLYQDRKWLWNKKIQDTVMIHRLTHHPLTEDYLVVDQKNGHRQSFNSLESALNQINNLSRVSLFNTDTIKADSQYRGRIKTYLNINSLPPPMRPQAFISKNWDISSKWYNWKILI